MARGEQLFRQWELLRTLQAHRYGLTLDELAERLECDRRTVQRDLRALANLFPVRSEQRDFGRKYWMLEGRFLDADTLPLTMTEMLSLYLSQQLLAPLEGTPFGDGLATALQKIRALLPRPALHYFEDLDDGFLIKSQARHDYSGQSRLIATLNDAIVKRRVVKVTYHSASHNRLLTTEMHPYGMVLLAASLYCIGHLAAYDEVRTLKVSRLQTVQATARSFQRPPDFSLDKHLRGSFGVWGPGRMRTLRVRLTGWAATNVREHQWHPSQQIVADDGESVEATFTLASTVEFKRWVLGFGRHAKVLEPAELAREVAEELAAAAAQYDAPWP